MLSKRMLSPMFEGDPGPGPVGGASAGAASGTPAAGSSASSGAGEESIPKSQVESIIRARIAEQASSMQSKYADHDKYKGVVERIAKITQRPVDDLARELEAIELQVGASQVGLPPQVFQEIVNTQNEVKTLKEENQKTKLDNEENALKANPTYATAFGNEESRKEIREFATKTGVSLEQAFWATQGSKQAGQMERDIEQRIMTKLKNNQALGGVINDTSTGATDLGLTPEELAYCRATNMAPEDYAALRGANSITAYRAYKAKRGKGA